VRGGGAWGLLYPPPPPPPPFTVCVRCSALPAARTVTDATHTPTPKSRDAGPLAEYCFVGARRRCGAGRGGGLLADTPRAPPPVRRLHPPSGHRRSGVPHCAGEQQVLKEVQFFSYPFPAFTSPPRAPPANTQRHPQTRARPPHPPPPPPPTHTHTLCAARAPPHSMPKLFSAELRSFCIFPLVSTFAAVFTARTPARTSLSSSARMASSARAQRSCAAW
jgi:hypothetical protein